MTCCHSCGRAVSGDETAITRKLINRGLPYSLCVSCLASHFEVTAADIMERIDYFKRMGCTLFEQNQDSPSST